MRHQTLAIDRECDSDNLWRNAGLILSLQLKPITDSHALTVGTEFVSQSFLMSTALSLVLFEWYRSTQAATKSAEMKKEEKALRQAVKEARLAAIEAKITDLSGRLAKLEGPPEGVAGVLSQFFSGHQHRHVSTVNNLEASRVGAGSPSTTAGAADMLGTGLMSSSASSNSHPGRPGPTAALVALPPASPSDSVMSESEREYLQQVEVHLHHAEQAIEGLEAAQEAGASDDGALRQRRGWLSWLWPWGQRRVSSASPTVSSAAPGTEAALAHASPAVPDASSASADLRAAQLR